MGGAVALLPWSLDGRPSGRGGNRRRAYGSFGNDWKVWDAVVNACSKMGTSEFARRTEELIDLYLQTKGRISAHARLAHVEYYVKCPPVCDDGINLYGACVAVYLEYATATVCSRKLRHVDNLPLHRQVEFTDMARELAMRLQHISELDGVCSDLSFSHEEVIWLICFGSYRTHA